MMKKAVKQLNFVGRFAARWEADVKRARGACKVRPEKLVHGFGTVGGWEQVWRWRSDIVFQAVSS